MSTNYSKWNAFDDSKESERIEKKWKVEDVQDKFKQEEIIITNLLHRVETNLRKVKDALRSHVCKLWLHILLFWPNT